MNALKAIKQLLPSKNHWPTFLLENRLMSFYEKQVGYRMDIKHPPTFTEKLQWYKLYYNGDGHLERIVDKYLFKDYIKEHLGEGYTIPLLGAWTDINQLEKDWNTLDKDPDDVETLEDLILTCLNGAMKKADEAASQSMGKYNIPGLM